jgi:hypothetical protein
MAMVEEMLDPKTTNSRAKMPNVATKMAATNHQNPEEISEAGQHGQPLSSAVDSSQPARINRCCFVQEQSAGSAGFFWKFSKTAIDRQVIWRTN